jgi:hypothetical protein
LVDMEENVALAHSAYVDCPRAARESVQVAPVSDT